jgi:sulfite reductase (ferredoxin)
MCQACGCEAPSSAHESKAQRAERLKRERNPWEMMPDLLRYAREGFDAIDPDDLNTRFRWWGIYTQGDGRGTFGEATPFFMLRIRIANGQLAAHQLRTIADLAARYARGAVAITNRQNFQLHWVRIEDVPDIFFALQRAGLTTLGACGDVTRNITGCPLAGVDGDEVVDASPIVRQATQMLVGNPEYYNLPRKYKISITGCRVWCSYPETNDIGLTAVRHWATGEIGFSLRVGGGLSTSPHFGVRLNAFVRWHQALGVIRGITDIFRDSDVLRQDRAKARLKFLFIEHGWDAQRFLEELERRIGFRLDPAVPEAPPQDAYRDHVGIHPQKQAGLYYAGFSVPVGRACPDLLHRVADLAERYGDGSVRTTNMQNIVVLNVPEDRLSALRAEADAAGLQLGGSAFKRGTVACTGSQFCKLAITETKGFATALADELERRLPGFGASLRINVTGCPNDCGQRWIADIGLQGTKMKVDGQQVDGYEVFLGGALGASQTFARRVKYRVAASQAADALERLLRIYLARRASKDETFHAFCARHRDEELRGFLAGTPETDAAPSTVATGTR